MTERNAESDLGDAIPPRIGIQIRSRAARIDRRVVGEVLEICLDGEGADPHATLALLVCGDRTMRSLNREFRGKDSTTDVLSFPGAGGGRAARVAPGEAVHLGDIAVSLPQCLRQAEELGVPAGDELVRLLVHGVLHVLGYDHEMPRDRARMFPRERGYRVRCARRGLGSRILRGGSL